MRDLRLKLSVVSIARFIAEPYTSLFAPWDRMPPVSALLGYVEAGLDTGLLDFGYDCLSALGCAGRCFGYDDG